MKTLNLDDATADELQAEHQRLSFAVAQGDTVAAVKLAKIEERIEENQRADRRRLAAAAEASRLEAEAAAQAAEAEQAAKLHARELWLEAKFRAYAQVQDVVDELVVAVKIALDAASEFRASNLGLRYPAGRLPGHEITDYVAWRLGRNGGAGLDFPWVPAALRKPLATREPPT